MSIEAEPVGQAEHVSYHKQETSVLEMSIASLQQRMLWAIDLEREGMETQIDCMNKIEQINAVLVERSRVET